MEAPDDNTYAPQSPDLTAATVPDQFEPHPQHREYRGSVSFSPFTPTSENRTPFGLPPSAHANYPPQAQPQPPQLSQSQLYQNPSYQPSPPGQPLPQQYNPYFGNAAGATPLQLQQSPQYSAAHFGVPSYTQQPPIYSQPYGIKQEEAYGSQPSTAMAPARGKKMKREEEVEAENNAPGVREGIEVRTKFPVARIKRIMQADEDVGKVAQVTPVAVSKALELFMISLVTKAAAQAKERGSKRVLAAHLKQAVLDDDQFDYLQEIVSKVAEAPAKNADKQEDSDEAMDSGAPAKRKRAAGGGRKKRKDSDEA